MTKLHQIAKNKLTIDANIMLQFLVMIDLLLIPYIYIVFPASLPFVVFFLVKNKVAIICKNNLDLALYLLISFFMLLSLFLSLNSLVSLIYAKAIRDNITRFLQWFFLFSYYIYFAYLSKNSRLSVKTIKFSMQMFVVFFFVLYLLYQYFLNVYFFVRLKLFYLTPISWDSSIESLFSFSFRYNFIYTDPNTAGAATILVLIFLSLFANSNWHKMFYSVLSLCVVLITGSRLSFVGFGLHCGYALACLSQRALRISEKKSILVFITCVLLLYVIFSLMDASLIENITNNKLIINNVERVLQTDKASEGRLGNIPKRAFKEMSIKPFHGIGYSQYIENNIFRPHSDHLRFIFSYGMLAYFCFLIFFFRNISNKKYYVFVLMLLAISLSQSLTDEIKIFSLILVMLAIIRNLHQKNTLQ